MKIRDRSVTVYPFTISYNIQDLLPPVGLPVSTNAKRSQVFYIFRKAQCDIFDLIVRRQQVIMYANLLL